MFVYWHDDWLRLVLTVDTGSTGAVHRMPYAAHSTIRIAHTVKAYQLCQESVWWERRIKNIRPQIVLLIVPYKAIKKIE